MRVCRPNPALSLMIVAVALGGCSAPSAPPLPAPAAAPVVSAQVTKALDLYRTLLQQQSWESAAAVGQDIVNRYPTSVAANEVRRTLPDASAKATALTTQRRLQALWLYQSGKESGGNQSTASLYSNDSATADRVRLILRRHSAWGSSAYLYDSGKGFECRGTCTLKLRIDAQPEQRIKAYLPPTGEPALFISDEKAFIAKLEHAQKISIDVVGKDRGTRTLVFEVGGYEPAKFLPLPKK
ncbi:MAG: hypothetical protein ABI082_00595 [Dokdonella sp.]